MSNKLGAHQSYKKVKDQKHGIEKGFVKQSRKPLSSPLRTDDTIEKMVIELLLNHKEETDFPNFSKIKRELALSNINISTPTIKVIIKRRLDLWRKD